MTDEEIAAWNAAFGSIKIAKGPDPLSVLTVVAETAREVAEEYEKAGSLEGSRMARAWRLFSERLDPRKDAEPELYEQYKSAKEVRKFEVVDDD